MKNKINNCLLIYIGCTLGIILWTGCSKDYNPDLRARWQLCTEIPLNGSPVSVDTIFYSFDNHVVDVQGKVNNFSYYQLFGRFTERNDSLILQYLDSKSQDLKTMARYYGVHALEEHYQIVQLNNNVLHLKNNDRELIFRKF